MKAKLLLSFIVVIAISVTQKLQAQKAIICDCKMENGKNVLVVNGSVTLTSSGLPIGKIKKYNYTTNVQIANKSSCIMKILGFTISNGTIAPGISIVPSSPDQQMSKSISTTKAASITSEGTNKIIKVRVRYSLNGKICTQDVELLYYDDTVKK